MKKTFTFKNLPAFNNHLQSELEQQIALCLRNELKSSRPGEMARKNIMGFAASLRSVNTRFGTPCEVILN